MTSVRGLTLKQLYNVVAERDGLFCHVGGERGKRDSLMLVSWDGDPKSRDPKNYFLVCETILRFMKSLIRSAPEQDASSSSYVCANARVDISEAPHQTSWELLKSIQSRPVFLHWLFIEVMSAGRISYKEALNSGAKISRLCSATTRRYLDEETSSFGMYTIATISEEKCVVLKHQWNGLRGRQDAKRKLAMQCKNWRDDLIEAVPGVVRCKKKRPKKNRGPRTDEDPSEPTPPP